MADLKIHTDPAGNRSGTDSSGCSASFILSGEVSGICGERGKRLEGDSGERKCKLAVFCGVSLKAEWKDGKLQTAFYLFGIPVSRILEKRREKNAAKAVETGKKEKTAKAAKKTKAAKTAKTEHDRSTIYKSTDDSQNNTESSAKNNINNHTENNGKETVDAENGGFEKMAEAGMTQQQKISEKPCSEMPDITGNRSRKRRKNRAVCRRCKRIPVKKSGCFCSE